MPDVLNKTLGGAETGATIGSIVPGVGTLVGGVAGAAIGLGSALFGANKAANERKKMEQYLNRRDAENQSWYNENALSDYTQRADTQNLMRQLRQTLDRRNAIANNTAVVTGATPEQQAVQKEQSNRVIADTYGNIADLGQRYKDMVTNKYLAIKNNLADQRTGMMQGNAESYENLFSNGLNSLANSGKTLASYFDYRDSLKNKSAANTATNTATGTATDTTDDTKKTT